jgi:hypothetical protein
MLSLHTIIFQKNEGRAHLPVPHSFHFSLLCENLLFCENLCHLWLKKAHTPCNSSL